MDYQFSLDNLNWLEYLEEFGFVVIINCISTELNQELQSSVIECLKKFSEGLCDEDSFSKSKNYPYLLHGGMIQYLGQSDFQWRGRLAVRNIFELIWGTKELYCSFDGLCYMGKRKYKSYNLNEFIHCDQNVKKNFKSSIQGLLNLYDNGPDDGGFICIPKSHKIFGEFLSGKEYKGDWYKFSNEEKQNPIFEQTIKINAPAGSMILWDSRLFHANTPPKVGPRACLYICMVPKSMTDKRDKISEKRMKMYRERRCSNHHPIFGKAFTKLPRFITKEQREKYLETIEYYHRTCDQYFDEFKDLVS